MRKSYLPARPLAALMAVSLLLGGCGEAPPPPVSSTVDNVVLICIDTVGADEFYSPTIDDALAQRLGTAQRYLNASSAAPWTIPSVATVLTGLYPVQHNAGQFPNVVANLDVDLPNPLSDSARTLAEILNDNDFRTGAVSAHPWFTAGFGLEQGFKDLHARRGWEKITSTFNEWLDETPAFKKKRFFGYLHFMEAHDWHLKSREVRLERMRGVGPELRAELLADTSAAACANEKSLICQRNIVYNYAVRHLRDAIDRVLASLEERDLLKNTLVVVYSDHGEEFWEHKAEHELRGDPRNIYGFGHGHSMYEELLRVPLVVWHPGIDGADREDLVSLVDVAPSILAWLGVEHPGDPMTGELLPTGSQAMRGVDEPRVVYASGIAYGAEAMVAREGELKSILQYPEETFQYFDLASDPGEHQPIEDDRLTLSFDVLTGDYIDMKKESLAAKARPEMDAATLEHLKSIGYLQGVEEPSAQNQAKQAAVKPPVQDGQVQEDQSQEDQSQKDPSQKDGAQADQAVNEEPPES